jgi:CheY-like chemotaxis protein
LLLAEHLASAPGGWAGRSSPVGSEWEAVLSHVNLLLVDDSQLLRRLAVVTLASLGDYEVDQAADAVEALEIMRDKDYDVVLTDYYMPGIDGIEFVRRVRALETDVRRPIIMVTTERDAMVEEEALAAGVDGFVMKPFRPAELRDTLARVLGPRSIFRASSGIDAQSVIDAMPYPVMVLDRYHNVLLGNTAFWRHADTGIGDAGVRCAQVMHATGVPPANCPLDTAVATGKGAQSEVLERGTRLLVSVEPMALTDAEGHPLYLHVAWPE